MIWSALYWMNTHPEILAFILNVLIFLNYTWRFEEPGKILYWLGACLITLGLLNMKG